MPPYAGMKRIVPYGLRDENCVMVDSIKESIAKKPKRIENVMTAYFGLTYRCFVAIAAVVVCKILDSRNTLNIDNLKIMFLFIDAFTSL